MELFSQVFTFFACVTPQADSPLIMPLTHCPVVFSHPCVGRWPDLSSLCASCSVCRHLPHPISLMSNSCGYDLPRACTSSCKGGSYRAATVARRVPLMSEFT